MIDWSALGELDEAHDVDARRFDNDIVPAGQPIVLRGLVRHWPSVARARESVSSLASYLQGFAAAAPVRAFRAPPEAGGRYFYRDDLRGFNFERVELPFAELLAELQRQEQEPGLPSLYAGAIPLRDEFAGILASNPNPLVDASIEQLASIWVGGRGRIPAHWDLPQNIACVVSGRRRFTLFPTEALPDLYVGPVDFTPAGQPISLVDFHAPDFERFPRFRDALRVAKTTVLAPGDAIYIPSMWFHHVESLDCFGVLINFWWRDAAPYMFTPLITMLHSLLSMRELPKSELAAWKTMFDHYVFRVNGDPMAHIPEDARGVFGPMTQERVAALRSYLLKSLGGEPRKTG